jgi:hypothetical protein
MFVSATPILFLIYTIVFCHSSFANPAVHFAVQKEAMQKPCTNQPYCRKRLRPLGLTSVEQQPVIDCGCACAPTHALGIGITGAHQAHRAAPTMDILTKAHLIINLDQEKWAMTAFQPLLPIWSTSDRKTFGNRSRRIEMWRRATQLLRARVQRVGTALEAPARHLSCGYNVTPGEVDDLSSRVEP